jgi:hypothetical protein
MLILQQGNQCKLIQRNPLKATHTRWGCKVQKVRWDRVTLVFRYRIAEGWEGAAEVTKVEPRRRHSSSRPPTVLQAEPGRGLTVVARGSD